MRDQQALRDDTFRSDQRDAEAAARAEARGAERPGQAEPDDEAPQQADDKGAQSDDDADPDEQEARRPSDRRLKIGSPRCSAC